MITDFAAVGQTQPSPTFAQFLTEQEKKKKPTPPGMPGGQGGSTPAPTGGTQPSPTFAGHTAPASQGSPVSSNGTITPAAAQPAAAPQAAAPAASAPAPSAPSPAQAQTQAAPAGSPGPGWTLMPNGGWLPPGHPAATGGVTTPSPGATPGTPPSTVPGQPGGNTFQPGLSAAPAGSVYTPGTMPTVNWQTYQGSTINVPTPQGYQAQGYAPIAAQGYQPGQISQFQGPNQAGLDTAAQHLLTQQYANPHSMSAQNVEQMKEQRKREQLAMQEQFNQQVGDRAAASGTFGGGRQAMQERQGQQGVREALMSGYSDIDIKKMQQDRLDERNLLSDTNDFQTGQMNRATAGYAQTLAGQQARENAAAEAARQGIDLSKLTFEQQAQFQRDLQAQSSDAFRGAELGFNVQKANADERFRTWDAGNTTNQNKLAQFGVQEQLKQAGAESAFNNWQGQNQQWKSFTDYLTAQQGLKQDADKTQVTKDLGMADTSLGYAKINSSDKQAQASNALSAMGMLLQNDQFGRSLGQNNSQFNSQMGFNYANLNNTFLSSLLSGLFK